MTAKEYLLQYQVAKSRARRKREQIEKLRADLLPSGISYDGMPGGNGGKTMADAFAKLDEMETELRAQIQDAEETAIEVMATIEKVEDERYRAILHDRYILGMRWEDIAECENYSFRHVTKLHGGALKKIDKILKDAPQCPI
jgi:DNA-directed RNA polymerase specialized sigma subunit